MARPPGGKGSKQGEQVKRWITTAEAMDRCQFDRAEIKRRDVSLASLGLPGRTGYQLALTRRRTYSRTGTRQWVEHGRPRAGTWRRQGD